MTTPALVAAWARPGPEIFSFGRVRRIAGGILLLAAVTAPMFIQLGRWPLVDPDEGRNAEVAREMLVSGQWVVPHFNGLPFLDKPPLLFWAIAGAFGALGVDEAAARLPAALSGVAVVLLALALGQTLLDVRRGLWTAAIVATSPLVLIFSRLVIFDMPFTALVTLVLWALVRGHFAARPARWLCLAGLSMGLAVLTKGPVGAVLPLLAWTAARGALPRAKRPAGRWAWIGMSVIAMAVVAPWVIAVSRAEPGFLRYAIVDETLQRFLAPARFNRAGPVYYPWVVAGSGLGVWAAVLLSMGPALARSSRWTERERAAVAFGLRAAGAMLVFFSLSASKRPGYVLPALVPLALVTAVGLTQVRRSAAAAVSVLGFAAAATGLIVLGAVRFDTPALAGLALGDASGALDRATMVAGATALLVWGAGVLASLRLSPFVSLGLAATLAPALYLTLLAPLDGYTAGRSAKALARVIPPDAELISFKHFRTGLPFYRGAVVPFASVDGHELTSNFVIRTSEELFVRGRLLSPADARNAFERSDSLYVLTDASRLGRLGRTRQGALTVVWADRRSVLVRADP